MEIIVDLLIVKKIKLEEDDVLFNHNVEINILVCQFNIFLV